MKKSTTLLVFAVAVVLLLPLSSCMHFLHSGHSEHPMDTKTISMFRTADFSIHIEIGPMQKGETGSIRVAVEPVHGRTLDSLTLHYTINAAASSGNSKNHDHSEHTDAGHESLPMHGTQRIETSAVMIPFAPVHSGTYSFTAEFSYDGDSEAISSSTVMFEVTQKRDAGWMGGMMPFSNEYYYIGGAVMALMMIVMWGGVR